MTFCHSTQFSAYVATFYSNFLWYDHRMIIVSHCNFNRQTKYSTQWNTMTMTVGGCYHQARLYAQVLKKLFFRSGFYFWLGYIILELMVLGAVTAVER